jgi:hypothetical protein
VSLLLGAVAATPASATTYCSQVTIAGTVTGPRTLYRNCGDANFVHCEHQATGLSPELSVDATLCVAF